ncbi:hypothetical protein TRFO_20049 [Tritrichomonas foetus]|uniref:RPGR-interacting protein 1 first C2 domain-containing protein n=1 Tax=Tritrichomonas foetus TaxID=1144522 RepID=A0A1J4KHN6_9EUKA|nr:hypothetical protein TRFO_20049 [Tritrichomonas foetus]|eukprot:OHT10562.1 hypothetical protein TRFO_20049 [Tritrichomonas foetus]
MNEIFRNRLLPEYSRQELEEEFIRCCESLDEKATEILKLEKQAQYLDGRLGRLQQDIEDQSRQQVCFDGKHAPIAYRQSQLTVKELQDQITELETDLAQRQLKRDKVLQEVRYFRSLLNFPGKRSKVGTTTNKGKRKTRAELARMLSVLLTNKQIPPQMIYRVQTAISILNHNLDDAEQPMRELMECIGESLQLFEMLDKKKQIKEREEKIEQMRAKLAELRQRHDEMTDMHKKLLQQYKDEAEQNNAKYKEVMDLQHEKEAKEAEAAKLNELQIIADGLKNEIQLLEDQKVKLKEDNDERIKKLREQMEEAIKKLKSELADLENHCAALRASNKDLESRVAELERQYADAKERRDEIEEISQKLQAEYMSLRGYFVQMLSQTNDDPFENQRFVDFLNQMGAKDWKFATIRMFQDDIEKLKTRKQLILEKMAKYENFQAKLNDMIASKNELIAALESQLQSLQIENGIMLDQMAVKPKQDYVEGAPHVEFEQEAVINLLEEETAIMISFREFNIIKPQILGPKKCQILLSIDFYEHETQMTRAVSPTDDSFDTSIMFTCKNDFQLRDYVKKSCAKVQFYKIIGFDSNPIGEAIISFAPFLDDKNEFTSTLTFHSPDSNVDFAEVKYEAGIYIPLLK